MKQLLFIVAALFAPASCSPLDWKEDQNFAPMISALDEIFGVSVPKTPPVTIRAARQRAAPNDFAIVRAEFSNLPSLEQFEKQVEAIAGGAEDVEPNQFLYQVESVSWWNFKDVARSRRHRLTSKSSGMAMRIDVIFPAPETGYVYMEISGQNWEESQR